MPCDTKAVQRIPDFAVNMGWLSDRLRNLKLRDPRSNGRVAAVHQPSPAPASTPPEAPQKLHQHRPISRDGNEFESIVVGQRSECADPWSTAYNEALSQFDAEVRELLGRERDLEAAFDKLSEANNMHKDQSVSRRVAEKLQTPLSYLDMSLGITSPLAGLDPASGAAFGIIQSVTSVSNTHSHEIKPLSPMLTRNIYAAGNRHLWRRRPLESAHGTDAGANKGHR